MAVKYDFDKQLALGKVSELLVDTYYSDRFCIYPVGMELERRGIDRIYRSRETGQVYLVEVKADSKAFSSGNMFVETCAYGGYNDNGEFVCRKPGWAYTSEATLLMYLIVHPLSAIGSGELCIFKPDRIRARMEEWADAYSSVSVRNNGYQGRGLLVPMSVAKEHTEKIVLIP
jgi:hypothetical protein